MRYAPQPSMWHRQWKIRWMDLRGKSKWENWSRVSKVLEGCSRKQYMLDGEEHRATSSFCFSTSRYSLILLATPATYPNACVDTQRTTCQADPISVRGDPIHHASNSLPPINLYTAPRLAQETKGLVSTRVDVGA